MALFCDFENVALGVKDAKYKQFDINKVLERLLLKGSIVVKKAYCDWERYREFKAVMHQASFELIEIPHVRQSGKNSADIRMVVDALDLCYTKAHVDTFVIISGDSDFSPLVSKLRENNKTVIGVGVKNSTSDLLIANCDEFIYYDDLVRDQVFARPTRSRGRGATARATPKAEGKAEAGEPAAANGGGARKAATRGRGRAGAASGAERGAAVLGAALPGAEAPVAESAAAPAGADAASDEARDRSAKETSDRASEAIELVVDTIEALAAERGADEKVWGSMVKQTLKRRRPGFNETYYGFRSFNRLLEEARDRGLIQLELDDKSGGYTVRCLD